MTKTDKTHPTLFKKKLCVAEPNIYQIQVKTCQGIIHKGKIWPEAAIKFG
jgi:hypothetical protein